MHLIATIISIAFVILHLSSVDSVKSKFNRERPIDRRRLLPESCPDGSIPIEGECKSILLGETACSKDHVVVRGHCRKVYPKGSGACGNNYEAIGTNCVESIPGDKLCPNGQTRVNGVCRIVVRPNYSCPEGSEMIRGTCYEVLTTKPNCPEGRKLVNGTCEEIVTTTTTTEPEPCPEGTERISNVCQGRLKPCGIGFKRISGECRYIDPHSYLCPPGFEWSNGRCRFGHI